MTGLQSHLFLVLRSCRLRRTGGSGDENVYSQLSGTDGLLKSRFLFYSPSAPALRSVELCALWVWTIRASCLFILSSVWWTHAERYDCKTLSHWILLWLLYKLWVCVRAMLDETNTICEGACISLGLLDNQEFAETQCLFWIWVKTDTQKVKYLVQENTRTLGSTLYFGLSTPTAT